MAPGGDGRRDLRQDDEPERLQPRTAEIGRRFLDAAIERQHPRPHDQRHHGDRERGDAGDQRRRRRAECASRHRASSSDTPITDLRHDEQDVGQPGEERAHRMARDGGPCA